MKENTIEPSLEATIELHDEERTRCEVWTRVMGYHRPVSAFNRGKQAEHQERTYFQERPTARPDARPDAHPHASRHASQNSSQLTAHRPHQRSGDAQREAA